MADQPRRILLFEEDYESMYDLKEHLDEAFGWEVVLSAAESLLERLGRERFDLLVVDIMIHHRSPDAEGNEVKNVHFEGVSWRKTGLEFVKRLRRGDLTAGGESTSPDVPVIMLSAVANDSVHGELQDEIAVEGYFEKPFRLEDLVQYMLGLLGE
jgi:CheY-like chemotaxis protein